VNATSYPLTIIAYIYFLILDLKSCAKFDIFLLSCRYGIFVRYFLKLITMFNRFSNFLTLILSFIAVLSMLVLLFIWHYNFDNFVKYKKMLPQGTCSLYVAAQHCFITVYMLNWSDYFVIHYFCTLLTKWNYNSLEAAKLKWNERNENNRGK